MLSMSFKKFVFGTALLSAICLQGSSAMSATACTGSSSDPGFVDIIFNANNNTCTIGNTGVYSGGDNTFYFYSLTRSTDPDVYGASKNVAGSPGYVNSLVVDGVADNDFISPVFWRVRQNFTGSFVAMVLAEMYGKTYQMTVNLTADGSNLVTVNSASVSEVPLPAALPLLAAGLGAMGFMGWRRKRKAVA